MSDQRAIYSRPPNFIGQLEERTAAEHTGQQGGNYSAASMALGLCSGISDGQRGAAGSWRVAMIHTPLPHSIHQSSDTRLSIANGITHDGRGHG